MLNARTGAMKKKSAAITERTILKVAAPNPPYHALKRTAGKNVMKGTVVSPISGLSDKRSSAAATVAARAVP